MIVHPLPIVRMHRLEVILGAESLCRVVAEEQLPACVAVEEDVAGGEQHRLAVPARVGGDRLGHGPHLHGCGLSADGKPLGIGVELHHELAGGAADVAADVGQAPVACRDSP